MQYWRLTAVGLSFLFFGCVSRNSLQPLILQPQPQYLPVAIISNLPSPGGRTSVTTFSLSILPFRILTNTLTVKWNEMVDPELSSFRLYGGTNSGVYFDTWETAGITNRMTITVTRLLRTKLYFVLTARDIYGLESLPSVEVRWPVPTTNSPLTNVTFVVEGPFPVALFGRTNLITGSWSHVTNLTGTNTVVRIDADVKFFFSTNRALAIRP